VVPIVSTNGEIEQILGYAVDVTDRVRAEHALSEAEEKLLQAQRMESIGQLAGGVAHDFNNLLTAITGHSELLLVDLPEDSPLREDAVEIRSAADRAASLTKQLLAFSRKQVMRPEVVDVNERIGLIEKMLRRLIGEHIELRTRLGTADHVETDPAKFEQAIMNLAVNARDAMPNGGLLTIATETVVVDDRGDLAPGRYVRLVVSDTGTGMDAETVDRIFEPFFTTKDVGKGTGLGLSTVYGIVKQSGGSVTCYSEVDVGTTFKIYLPSADKQKTVQAGEVSKRRIAGGAETILLTEDQDNVRRLAATVLSRLGYTVLAAAGPEEALGIAERYDDPIDLLLTDVVMPGMNGPEVAERIRALRPETTVMFMSGYTDDALERHGVTVTDRNDLEKPFTPDVLAKVVRHHLDTKAALAAETFAGSAE
jgi:nitrogen-specific signal transduction histidine kinase/ActR/RegA family two-component response regulator